MMHFQLWPPPDWTECVVAWDYLVDAPFDPQALYDWCNNHPGPGRYHVHGWRAVEGFAFRFENPLDAVLFKLTWRCE